MNELLQNLHYAWRQARKAPGFTLLATITLALGVGAATAIFSVVDATLLRPLPFAHQERLVALVTRSQSGYTQPMSYPSYKDMRTQLSTMQAFTGYMPGNVSLQAPVGEPSVVRQIQAGDGFFDVFGIHPLMGRGFLPGEEVEGRNRVVVLSYETWQEQFQGDTNIIGHTARINGNPYTVVGVMPANFRYPLAARNAIYTPLDLPSVWRNQRGSHELQGIALLREGVTFQQATADVQHILANLAKQYPDTDAGRTGSVVHLNDSNDALGKAKQPLYLLAWAVLALLGIACVNVAGLLLARGVKREREIALRAAVGADRMRLIRQMLTETLVLSVAGCVMGIAFGHLLLSLMRTYVVHALARGVDVRMDITAVLVAVALSVISSVIAGLAPAIRLSRTAPNAALRSESQAGTGRSQHRLRSIFVVTQVALSLVLLVFSAVLLRHLQQTLHADLGFDPNHILTVDVNLPAGEYSGRDPMATFYTPLLEKIRVLPGVQGAGITNMIPIREWGSNSEVHIAGQPPYPKNQQRLAEQRIVSAGYMEAMGAHLTGGRALSPSLDTPDLKVINVIVNDAFQRMFFPGGGEAVGSHTDDGGVTLASIVGKYSSLRQNLQSQPLAEMDYLAESLPLKQRLDYLQGMVLVVHTAGDPKALINSVRDTMHSVDATVPFKRVQTMREVMQEEMLMDRMQGWLFSIFAGLALLLTLIGIYGTMQHEVELATRDIGIRMALGSSRSRVLSSVLQRTAVLLTVGIVFGLSLTSLLQRVGASLLNLQAPPTILLLGSLSLLLLFIGICAALLPAQRAASTDPMKALRAE